MDRLSYGLVGDRTHVTKFLGKDQIRGEPLKEVLVKSIDAAAGMQCGADVHVDISASPLPVSVKRTACNDGKAGRFRREVALMRDRHQSVAETQCEHDLRRARKQRADRR